MILKVYQVQVKNRNKIYYKIQIKIISINANRFQNLMGH